jgi:hypothetical protein
MKMAYLPAAQVNDSQVYTPVIVFQVNLTTQNLTSHLPPNRTTLDGNEVTTEEANLPNTRSVWLPGLVGNIEGIGPNGFVTHGTQFTVKGEKALYLKKLYVTGSVDDVLKVVSQS